MWTVSKIFSFGTKTGLLFKFKKNHVGIGTAYYILYYRYTRVRFPDKTGFGTTINKKKYVYKKTSFILFSLF